MTSLPPGVGPLRAEWLNHLCGYAPMGREIDALDECLADATWHGIALNPDQSAVLASMSSCDKHKARMAFSAHLVHPMSDACGMPEAEIWWDHDLSGCRINWDPAADQLSAALPAPAVAGE